MISIKNDKFEGKDKRYETSVFVITDEFPMPSDKNDKTFEFISKLACKHKAKRVNSPISYHNDRQKMERTIKVSFDNADDKNEFISDLQSCAN